MSDLADRLLALSDTDPLGFIQRHAADFTPADLDALKAAADRYLRADVGRCRRVGDWLTAITQAGGNPLARAQGLIVHANACALGGQGEYAEAVAHYDAAAALYAAHNRPVDQARTQIGKVWALGLMSRYQEAADAGAWAAAILEAHGEWVLLARLTSNLGVLHSRQGDETAALAMFEQARAAYLELGALDNPYLGSAELNCAVALRALGRFDEAIATAQHSRALFLANQEPIEATRALQCVAAVHLLQGHYTQALNELEQVKAEYLADDRVYDALVTALWTGDCLIQLRRFDQALALFDEMRGRFAGRGSTHEVAHCLLMEARALEGLHRLDDAWQTLGKARDLYAHEHNAFGCTYAELQQAALESRRGRDGVAAEQALACAARLAELARPVEEAYARLVAARGLITTGKLDEAATQVTLAQTLGQVHTIPMVAYHCHHLQGTLAAARGDGSAALAALDQAIAGLELLRGRLMLEFRAAFVEDKQSVYADAALLCVQNNRPDAAFTYAERAKSRALVDLMAQHISLKVRARSPVDQPLVEELMDLRAARDRIQWRWEGNDTRQEDVLAVRAAGFAADQQSAAALEQRITELWHRLLTRNAAYATDAALWQARVEPVQPLLPADTLLLEYFNAGETLLLFEVTRDAMRVRQLPLDQRGLHHLLQLLRLNLAAAPTTPPEARAGMETQARRILARLYAGLLAPTVLDNVRFPRLIIVPHGVLHYLPFHALHDGQAYLAERHEISYLPSAGFLHYCRPSRRGNRTLAAFAYSAAQALPHTIVEAQTVARVMGGCALVEAEATKNAVIAAAAHAGILHFATHGDFRGDNPLFSGLALADGWLTTLDIFDLELHAGLVTLSACQTGRSVVGGGDELLGLMRAFVSAGAAGLLLSHWPVDDAFTAQFMEEFYRRLAGGATKRAALTETQRSQMTGVYSHPYFWASFYLTGDPGPL